ncbi:MAG: prolyl oligopeptidase family serine peptidase, partial [Sphingomonadaceae bacterium]|nr:prolyl oligopeptidase family serine peptidase [Sphingomonadaceae bacterium]
YRCAVSVAGPGDLRAMLAYETDLTAGSNNSTLRSWQRFMGAKSRSDPALDAISPAKLAAKVDVPVLLIHGKDDTVVNYEQSRIMAAALTKAGHPPEFVTLASEDHWLSRGETRTAMLTATLDFLARHLPPDAAAAGSAKAAAAP